MPVEPANAWTTASRVIMYAPIMHHDYQLRRTFSRQIPSRFRYSTYSTRTMARAGYPPNAQLSLCLCRLQSCPRRAMSPSRTDRIIQNKLRPNGHTGLLARNWNRFSRNLPVRELPSSVWLDSFECGELIQIFCIVQGRVRRNRRPEDQVSQTNGRGR